MIMIIYNNERSVFNYNTLNEGIIFYSYRIMYVVPCVTRSVSIA